MRLLLYYRGLHGCLAWVSRGLSPGGRYPHPYRTFVLPLSWLMKMNVQPKYEPSAFQFDRLRSLSADSIHPVLVCDEWKPQPADRSAACLKLFFLCLLGLALSFFTHVFDPFGFLYGVETAGCRRAGGEAFLALAQRSCKSWLSGGIQILISS